MRQTAVITELDLTFLLKKEASVWTALCLELDIASCGATERDAVESLRGLVDLYVEDCMAKGERPIPMRPVPCNALQDFLSPPDQTTELPIISRRASFRIHAHA